MTRRLRFFALSCLATLGAASAFATDADACGGCFHAADDPETTVVTGHRMAFAISPTQTVLWDQVEYTGSPQEFAWVLPIKKGARLEVASNAWFEALDAATSTRVVQPQLFCADFGGGDFDNFESTDSGGSGCGCFMMSADSANYAGGGTGGGEDLAPPPPPVEVVRRETVGPYEVVTLATDTPGVLTDWLQTHGFAVDAEIQPIIDQYVAEDFDFIAMRLAPGEGVQSMKPVRVLSPGATPVMPLRMVAAGTGANTAITLYVIGEGRWEAKNFPNAKLEQAEVTWDFATQSSDYSVLRSEVLAKDNARTFLSSYARQGPLLSPVQNSTGQMTRYMTDASPQQYSTIGDLFVQTAILNGEASEFEADCAGRFLKYAPSADVVVNPCAEDGTCAAVEPGQIDARDFECAGVMEGTTLDDLAVAFTGMHPSSVWLTRIEGNLSRVALELDLELQAEKTQVEVDNWLTAGKKQNTPCVESAVAPLLKDTGATPRERRQRKEFAAALLALVGIGAALGRRVRRALPAPSAQ
ncbi:DUF2330 domain-containing protein [Polyangium spumosum]|uniref:DUF2330 domain-containing protein n=1 Tax=Polyangium spumosum TaxID=889282 RepID=A0A6N7PWP5_9BACT|nr:DUF2330 domain-containing protein [Polyangium spumosum]MRG95266.1 DUF2330 domain-containing protein [Polyangium spumosum]